MEHNIKVTRDLVYTAMQKLDDKGYKSTRYNQIKLLLYVYGCYS